MISIIVSFAQTCHEKNHDFIIVIKIPGNNLFMLIDLSFNFTRRNITRSWKISVKLYPAKMTTTCYSPAEYLI